MLDGDNFSRNQPKMKNLSRGQSIVQMILKVRTLLKTYLRLVPKTYLWDQEPQSALKPLGNGIKRSSSFLLAIKSQRH